MLRLFLPPESASLGYLPAIPLPSSAEGSQPTGGGVGDSWRDVQGEPQAREGAPPGTAEKIQHSVCELPQTENVANNSHSLKTPCRLSDRFGVWAPAGGFGLEELVHLYQLHFRWAGQVWVSLSLFLPLLPWSWSPEPRPSLSLPHLFSPPPGATPLPLRLLFLESSPPPAGRFSLPD